MSFEPYLDEYGLIVQRDKDGGDAVYRNALYSVLASDIKHWNLTRSRCEVAPGIWVRHPDKTKWYSDPSNCSRDQVAKAMLAAAYFSDKSTIKRWLFQQTLRLGFHQNNRVYNDSTKWKMPDIISPNEIANVIRGLDLVFLYPLLYLLDATFIFDLIFRKKNTWDYDSLIAINIWYANIKYPTFISKLVYKYYLKTDFRNRIIHNFCRTENDICPLGRMYVEFIK